MFRALVLLVLFLLCLYHQPRLPDSNRRLHLWTGFDLVQLQKERLALVLQEGNNALLQLGQINRERNRFAPQLDRRDRQLNEHFFSEYPRNPDDLQAVLVNLRRLAFVAITQLLLGPKDIAASHLQRITIVDCAISSARWDSAESVRIVSYKSRCMELAPTS
jgi:hypothetical protein